MILNSKTLKTNIVVFMLLAVMLTACSKSIERAPVAAVQESPIVENTASGFINRLNETGLGLVREVPASNLKHTSEDVFIGKEEVGMNIADLRWLDCKTELTEDEQKRISEYYPHMYFTYNTIFPDTMPADFDPEEVLEVSRNPGLGVRSLHSDGINGSGVGVAIIDQVLYTGHPEYSEQLALYEEIHVMPNEGASMHGSAVASIAVGKSCGVAPGAKLYYWAVNLYKDTISKSKTDENLAFAEGLAVAIDRVLEVNKTLPDNEKIRVISISRGFRNLEDEGVKTFLAAVERAKEAGIFVITTSTFQYYDWLSKDTDFAGLGKVDYTGDPDELSTYTLGAWEQIEADKYTSMLLVPMDARTTADFTEDGGYVFYSDGGWSWVAPYVAGVYALACQAKPDITPEEFYKAAISTSDVLTVKIQTETGGTGDAGTEYTLQHVINPAKLIASLSKG